MNRRDVLRLFGTSSTLALPSVIPTMSFAQTGTYPSQTITIIVGSTPGSATDLAARLSAQILQEAFKQNVVVDNRPGAGGIITMTAVAAAKPDGYVLQVGGLGHNVIPPVTRTGLPIDIPKTIMPIFQVAEFLNLLVVGVNHPARTLGEFIDYSKKQDKTLLYGSNGVGSSSHMTSELFGIRAGLAVQHVPYKGASDALVGVANGDLDLLFMNMPPSLPMIQAGKLRALAVTSSYRARQLPDVPTMQEAGMADFDVTSWLGVYGPTGMPSAIVTRLSDTLMQGFDTPESRQRLIDAGFEPKLRSTKEFTAFNQAELKRWGEVARLAGISLPYGN